MRETPQFVSASALTLDAFARLYTRSFENYFYPMAQTTQALSGRVRTEQIDLFRSVVLMLGDVPAGQATFALRADRGWCAGFGLVPEFRGQRLGPPLFAEFITQARQAGAKTLLLEVLTRNTPALHVYTSAGMHIQRDLRLLEWKRDEASVTTPTVFTPEPANMADVAAHFHRLHAVPHTWGRELSSLLLRRGLCQCQFHRDGQLEAYVLFWWSDGVARIDDLAARNVDHAVALLTQLQSHCTKITSINEPDDSPLMAAFDRCGFHEFDRQHELAMTL